MTSASVYLPLLACCWLVAWVGKVRHRRSAQALDFASDSSHIYYITGAPQCPIPEPNMGEIITAAQVDYLWVQFYNNPYCSNPSTLNYDDWVTYVSGTPSANAKIFLGVSASSMAATGTNSGAQYHFPPRALTSAVNEVNSTPSFGGIMMWSAGFSDSKGEVYNYPRQEHASDVLEEPLRTPPNFGLSFAW
jgi:chitinase